MNLRPRRRSEPEVNMTSMIDVVFLLLLFFMLTTTFNTLARLHITLPQASEKPTPQPQNVLVVTITAHSRFFVDNRELVNNKPATVKRALAQALGQRKNLPVIIKADGRTPHQAVVTALDAASQLGLIHISMATTHEHDGH